MYLVFTETNVKCIYIFCRIEKKLLIKLIHLWYCLFIPNLLKDGIKCLVVKKNWKVIFLILFFSDDCKFYSSVRTETFFHQFSFSLTEKNMIHFSEVSTVHKVSKDILNKYIHCDIIIATCDNKCIISRLMFVFHCCHKVLFQLKSNGNIF